MRKYIFSFLALFVFVSCTVSYKFNGVSIDYTKIQTIEIRDFQNQTGLAPPLFAQQFSESMKDHFTKNTKLKLVNNPPAHLEIEGEVIRYDLSPVSVGTGNNNDFVAPKTRLTINIKMRFRNNVNSEEDKEETFSTYRDFPSETPLEKAQVTINEEIIKEIVDQIFNTTLSNW